MTAEFCPSCGEPWPQALAYPMALVRCETCREEKRRRLEAWGHLERKAAARVAGQDQQ